MILHHQLQSQAAHPDAGTAPKPPAEAPLVCQGSYARAAWQARIRASRMHQQYGHHTPRTQSRSSRDPSAAPQANPGITGQGCAGHVHHPQGSHGCGSLVEQSGHNQQQLHWTSCRAGSAPLQTDPGITGQDCSVPDSLSKGRQSCGSPGIRMPGGTTAAPAKQRPPVSQYGWAFLHPPPPLLPWAMMHLDQEVCACRPIIGICLQSFPLSGLCCF